MYESDYKRVQDTTVTFYSIDAPWFDVPTQAQVFVCRMARQSKRERDRQPGEGVKERRGRPFVSGEPNEALMWLGDALLT